MYAAITSESITTETVLRHVGDDEDGAVCVFVGVVRDHNEGRLVRGVHYSAYESMATKVLTEIAGEAAVRAGTDRLAVVHRTGELRVGEASVAIAVSTPHREQAFDACRYVIEQIKQRLPVWKQERYADGDDAWLDGAVPEVPHA
ncbi:MAG: molybdenum cofactor biosynthesis protein MoaE [Longimicrobiales bacterium]